jgi:hypothetical protein
VEEGGRKGRRKEGKKEEELGSKSSNCRFLRRFSDYHVEEEGRREEGLGSKLSNYRFLRRFSDCHVEEEEEGGRERTKKEEEGRNNG